MRAFRTAVLTGIAALAVAGVGFAAAHDAHSMKVQMPDGSFARIDYVSEVAPNVTVVPSVATASTGIFDLFDDASLPMFNQVASEMDRQVDAMLRQAQMPQAAPRIETTGSGTSALGALPVGTVQYQSITTADGMGTCERSVVTSFERDHRPHVVSSVSGGCDKVDRTAAPVAPGNARTDVPAPSRNDGMPLAERLHAATV